MDIGEPKRVLIIEPLVFPAGLPQPERAPEPERAPTREPDLEPAEAPA